MDSLYVVEECLSNEHQIRAFHTSSLNTVRIVTVRGKKNKIYTLGSFIRFGTKGHIVDNGGNDEILAEIDIETGEIITAAYDKFGTTYENHPDTWLPIRGFIIPKFDQLIDTCKAAHMSEPCISIVGWDVVLTDKDQIENIEGNHRPDAYGLQVPQKKAIKPNLCRC